jgi:N6-adenosine-specific RNA methylase IME4
MPEPGMVPVIELEGFEPVKFRNGSGQRPVWKLVDWVPRRSEFVDHAREFYALVDSLCIGRKLDIFSREARPGCEQFGNEPGKFEGAA